MEKEFESKGLISKKQFNMLLETLEIIEVRNQINSYLDTHGEFFKNHKSALRLRKINDTYHFSLKRQDTNGCTEWNQQISENVYHRILTDRSIDLAQFDCPATKKLANLEIIEIATTRYVCRYHNTTIELDITKFNQTTDFEIEIEAIDMETANQLMRELVTEYDLVIKKSYPKIARYHLYN